MKLSAKHPKGNGAGETGSRTKGRVAKERPPRLMSEVQLEALERKAKYGEGQAERRLAATRLINGVDELRRALKRTGNITPIALRERIERATYMVERLFGVDDSYIRLRAAQALLDDGAAVRMMLRCRYLDVKNMARTKQRERPGPNETDAGNLPLPESVPVRGRPLGSWV